MAFKCTICGKGKKAGKSVSHSHKASNRYFMPNLQRVRIKADESTTHVYVCTTCIKSGRIQKT